MNGFGVYCVYCAIKAHFTTEDYDYIKYNGKLGNIDINSYLKRNDVIFFERAAREFKKKQELVYFFVANFAMNENYWIGDLMQFSETHATYKFWLEKIANLVYHAGEEVSLMFRSAERNGKTWESLFEPTLCSFPPAFKMLQQNMISMETFLILDSIYGIIGKIDDRFDDDDLIWGRWRLRLTKYRLLVVVDPFVDDIRRVIESKKELLEA